MFVEYLANVPTAINPNLQGPFASVLYVDQVRGSDVTGARGNNNLPFATIQAALNAMQTDDTVQLAPQLFTITTQLTVPATVIRGACVGYKPPGILNTTAWPGSEIFNSTGGSSNSWEFGANLGMTRFYLSQIMHRGVISADGSVAPYAKDGFFTGGLWITNCTGFMTFKYATQVVVQGPGGNGNYVTTGCGSVQFIGISTPGGNCTVTWDAADALTTTGNSGTQFLTGCALGAITMAKQAHVLVDELSRVSTISGSGGLTVSGANVPLVACCGFLTNVDFSTAGSELPDTATAITCDFRGTRFYYNDRAVIQPATSIKFKVAGVAANVQTAKMDSTVLLPGCTVTADAGINITGRGGDWPAVVLTTPGASGTIIPPQLEGTVNISAGGTVAKIWAADLGYTGFVRAGAAPDVAFVTSIAAAADAVISVKATTGLTFISAVVAGNTAANWMAIWK